MNNLNDTLPGLMHRATENLEPVSTDLLERTVQQGVRLRKRRTTRLTVAGASAVLATAGLVVGATQVLGRPSDVAVAGTTPTPTPSAKAQTPVTPQETLATLHALTQRPGLTLTAPEARGGGKEGFNAVAYVVNDGLGASRVEAIVEGSSQAPSCAELDPGSCVVRADGSVLVTLTESPEYPPGRNVDGVVSNHADLYYPDGRHLGITSYNAAAEKDLPHTRTKPLFTTAQLTTIVASKTWKFPAASTVKPSKGATK